MAFPASVWSRQTNPGLPSARDVIHPWSKPLYPHGHLAILSGNLATEGAVAKITGVKQPRITGPSRGPRIRAMLTWAR